MVQPAIESAKLEASELREFITQKTMVRFKLDNMAKDTKLNDPTSKFYQQPVFYALSTFAFYNCHKCKKAYYGGRRDCEQNADAEAAPAEEFICFHCADIKLIKCSKRAHAEFHEWKCRYCCKIAIWFCHGNTHYCDWCHSHIMEARRSPKKCTGKKENCPLKVDHPKNGGDDFRKKETAAKKHEEIEKEMHDKKPPAKRRKSGREGRKWGR